jgi:hypothetical protein
MPGIFIFWQPDEIFPKKKNVKQEEKALSRLYIHLLIRFSLGGIEGVFFPIKLTNHRVHCVMNPMLISSATECPLFLSM